MSSPLRIAIVVVAVIALAVQLVGMVVPAWLRIDVKSPNDGIYVETVIGIWWARVCVKTGISSREICAKVEMDKAMSNSKWEVTSESQFEETILKLKLLTVFGIIGAFCGTCLGIVHARKGAFGGTKAILVGGLFVWMLSGVLTIVAAWTQLNEHDTMNKALDKSRSDLDQLNIDVNILFPWATIISGVGGLLAFLSIILIGVELKNNGDIDNEGGQQGMVTRSIGYKA